MTSLRGRPTQYPNGVSNALALSYAEQSKLPFPDPTRFHVFLEDFNQYTAAQWAVTGTNAGTPALLDGDGGLLTLANVGALDNDGTFIQSDDEGFLWESDKKMWFKARVQVSEVIQSDMVLGLAITTSPPLTPTDQIGFRKSDGDAGLSLVIEKDSTETVVDLGTDMVDATYIELGWYYDGAGTFYAYADDVLVGSTTVTTNAPDDTELALTFGVQNGEPAAKNGVVDYLFAAKER